MTTPVIKIVQPPAVVVRTIPAGTTLVSGSAFVGELTADVEALQAEQLTQNTAINAAAAAAAAAQTTANGKVSKSGDTMTGALSLIAPTANAHAARKQDVDARILRAGDTMTGPLGVLKPNAIGQPTQLNAYDPVAGRRLVDGVEQGWTGWRRLWEWDASGTAIVHPGAGTLPGNLGPRSGFAGWIEARRIGDHVDYRAENISITSAGAFTGYHFVAAEPGQALASNSFAARPGIVGVLRVSANSLGFENIASYPATIWTLRLRLPVNGVTWPTSLPGTLITAPYSLPV